MLLSLEVFNQSRAQSWKLTGDAKHLNQLAVVVVVESVAVRHGNRRILIMKVHDLIRAANTLELQLQSDGARSLNEQHFLAGLQRRQRISKIEKDGLCAPQIWHQLLSNGTLFSIELPPRLFTTSS